MDIGNAINIEKVWYQFDGLIYTLAFHQMYKNVEGELFYDLNTQLDNPLFIQHELIWGEIEIRL